MGSVRGENLRWHYTNAVGLLGIVEKRQLWATHFRFMNDTMEGVLMTEALETFIARQTGLAEGERDLLRNMLQSYQGAPHFMVTRVPDGNHFLLCGSKSGDELTLWRNYARDSISFAVGLDPEVPLGVIPPGEWNASSGEVLPWFDVDYRESGTELPAEYAGRLIDAVKRADLGDRIVDIDTALVDVLSRTKSAAFKDERECRVVSVVDSTALWRYRAGPLGITPYIALGTTSAWGVASSGEEVLPIRAIRLSANATPADHLALNALLENNGFGGGVEVEEVPTGNGGHVEETARLYAPSVDLLQAKNSLRV